MNSYTMLTEKFHLQGDILFLHMGRDPIRAGDIVVYNVDVRFFYVYCYYVMEFFAIFTEKCCAASLIDTISHL